ncbi:MAG: methylmalonyl-CoA/ethylmalonyl-CoA epimerase [Rhodothermales bacterium]|jgi:methylmalonyl-CoA/ethylmalonyl-CoA epimerase
MRRLEHVGIAVQDVAEVRKILKDVLGREVYKSEGVASEGVQTHFLNAGSTKLELLEATSEDSPIAGFLAKRGPGVHHLAFEVDDLAEEADRLAGLGYTLLAPPKPGADGKRIAFLHPRDTARVLIELCEQVSFPPQFAPPAGQPTVFIPKGTAADALAHSLARHARVTRTGPPKKGQLVVAVDAWSGSPPSPDVFVAVASAPDAAVVPGMVIGIGHPGDVSIPADLWSALPDAWALIADLVATRLT